VARNVAANAYLVLVSLMATPTGHGEADPIPCATTCKSARLAFGVGEEAGDWLTVLALPPHAVINVKVMTTNATLGRTAV